MQMDRILQSQSKEIKYFQLAIADKFWQHYGNNESFI